METSFESTTSSIGAVPVGAPPEVVFEAPRPEVESEPIASPMEVENSQDFEAEAIMNIPGASHQKLEALAEGKIEQVIKPNSSEEEVPAMSLEERVMELQSQVIELMLMQMRKEKDKKPSMSQKELVAKIKELIEEAEGSKDKSPQIMSALVGLLMMAFALGEKSADSLEKQLSAN